MSFNAKDMTQGGQIASMRRPSVMGETQLADVCEWGYLLVVYHA